MKVNLDGAPRRAIGEEVEVGNVYRNIHGRIYVIISIHQKEFDANATALVVERTGEITNAVSYSTVYFQRFPVLGKASNLQDIEIDWLV